MLAVTFMKSRFDLANSLIERIESQRYLSEYLLVQADNLLLYILRLVNDFLLPLHSEALGHRRDHDDFVLDLPILAEKYVFRNSREPLQTRLAIEILVHEQRRLFRAVNFIRCSG